MRRRDHPRQAPRGKAREDAITQLSGEFVDGARFFDARAAVQAAVQAVDEALLAIARVPHPGGVNPLGPDAVQELVEVARKLVSAAATLFPRGMQTLATLGWSYGPIKSEETWPQRWMEIATTRPPGHPEAWPWPKTWPASIAREAALRGKRWLLETEPADAAWVEYKDGCRETIREVHKRTGAEGPWWKWTCRHRHRVRGLHGAPPLPQLRPATDAALRAEVGPPDRMKKRAQRARGRRR